MALISPCLYFSRTLKIQTWHLMSHLASRYWFLTKILNLRWDHFLPGCLCYCRTPIFLSLGASFPTETAFQADQSSATGRKFCPTSASSFGCLLLFIYKICILLFCHIKATKVANSLSSIIKIHHKNNSKRGPLDSLPGYSNFLCNSIGNSIYFFKVSLYCVSNFCRICSG